jgi:hypothetical protein
MKKNDIEKRRKVFVLIVAVLAVLILTADLLLIGMSLKNGQVGRGLSRYRNQEK